jgi:hypothetical protein
MWSRSERIKSISSSTSLIHNILITSIISFRLRKIKIVQLCSIYSIMKISQFLAVATAISSVAAMPSGPIAKRVESISEAQSKALHARQDASKSADGIVSLIMVIEDLIRNKHNAYVRVPLFTALTTPADHC